jgi:hypothetical protein
VAVYAEGCDMSRKNRTGADGKVRPRLGPKPHKRPGKAERERRRRDALERDLSHARLGAHGS